MGRIQGHSLISYQQSSWWTLLYLYWLLGCCQWPSSLVCTLKTTDWQIKNTRLLWRCELWKQTTAADPTTWVSHIDIYGRSRSDETNWSQAADRALHCLYCHYCCLCPSLYWTWPTPIRVEESMFLMQRLPLHVRPGLLTKGDAFVSQRIRPRCMSVAPTHSWHFEYIGL